MQSGMPLERLMAIVSFGMAGTRDRIASTPRGTCIGRRIRSTPACFAVDYLPASLTLNQRPELRAATFAS
jgi:hypothetical protein